MTSKGFCQGWGLVGNLSGVKKKESSHTKFQYYGGIETFLHPPTTRILTLTDRAPIPTSILAPITDRDIKYFSGGSCAFLEKIAFSSHSGKTAP